MRLYEFGRFRLDPDRMLLYYGDVPVALGPKVVETLLALLERPGEIHSKRALLARVWPEGYVEEANLAQNIYVLRKLLHAHGYDGAIETLSRRGYRFVLAVRSTDDAKRAARGPRWRAAVAAIGVTAVLVVVGASAYGRSREPMVSQVSIEKRLYTIGNFYLDRRTEYSVRRAILFFSRAIADRPRDARNYAARATAYAIAADNGFGAAPPQRARARADALQALALDPTCGGAHAALGLLALDAGRYDEALAELDTAVVFAPANADARSWLGIALLAKGQIAQADQQLQIAERLDPLSIVAVAWLSSASYLDRRYADAIAYARDGLSMAPQRTSLWITLGLAQEAEGRYGDALESFERYGRGCAKCKSESAALLTGDYVQLHEPERALAELTIARADLKAVRPEDLVLATAAAGEGRTAALSLRMTRVEKVLVANDPRFGRLTNNERVRLLSQG
jgi:DNA-binding winged helix-turn-helix (wHTH) protein/Flp pilus assembly protein TadD